MALGPGKSQSLGPALAVNTKCCQARCRESKAVTEDLPHVVTSKTSPSLPVAYLTWAFLLWASLLALTTFFSFINFFFSSSQGFMSLLFVETGSTGGEKKLLSSHGWVTAAGKAHLMQITTFHDPSESPAAKGKENTSSIYV